MFFPWQLNGKFKLGLADLFETEKRLKRVKTRERAQTHAKVTHSAHYLRYYKQWCLNLRSFSTYSDHLSWSIINSLCIPDKHGQKIITEYLIRAISILCSQFVVRSSRTTIITLGHNSKHQWEILTRHFGLIISVQTNYWGCHHSTTQVSSWNSRSLSCNSCLEYIQIWLTCDHSTTVKPKHFDCLVVADSHISGRTWAKLV